MSDTTPMLPEDISPDMQESLSKTAWHLLAKTIAALFNAPAISLFELSDQINVQPVLADEVVSVLETSGCEIIRTGPMIRMVRIGFTFMLPVLLSLLKDRGFDLDTRTFAQTGSTNDECFAAAASGADKPVAVIADFQTSGRGRRGNSWEAKPGQSALVSLLLPACNLPVETLSLAAGLAVAESLSGLSHRRADLKWPNDVMIDGRKIAGVLIETRANARDPAQTDYVIGVGVNVMQTHKDFPPDLAPHAISLAMIRRIEWDNTNVLVSLLQHLHHRCYPLASGEELIPLWRSRCRMLGQKIRVSHAGTVLEGTVADIDPLEGLILRDHQGISHACLTSHTTVLPA